MSQRYAAECPAYLKSQLITYLGNKRALLEDIDRQICVVRDKLGGRKLVCGDLFSGSGAVARLMKRHAQELYVNDLEGYSAILNQCYLANRKDFPKEDYEKAFSNAQAWLKEPLEQGILAEHYAPRRDDSIQPGERVFYTGENARIIDTLRGYIDTLPEGLRPFFLGPLLAEASVHNNTGGVFKGFYKDSATGVGKFGGNGENALPRILGRVELRRPVLSAFSCQSRIFRQDAGTLAEHLPPLDLVYLDPPYNQHPYGSNYFMLNVIAENRLPGPISQVSGIPQGWNRSDYNKQAKALPAFSALLEKLDARYLLISYNSEGFITLEQMESLLARLGTFTRTEIAYNAYRASRNLAGRSLYVNEYLFLLKKEG